MREKKIDFELKIARYFSNTVGCIVARLQNHQSCTILHNESYTMLHNAADQPDAAGLGNLLTYKL